MDRTSIDPAALGAAVVGAVLSLAVSPGRYIWLDTAIGVALASLLIAYYDPEPVSTRRAVHALAVGATAGLVAVLVASWPVQLAVGTPADCTGAPDHVADCAGDAATDWLGAVWLVAGGAAGASHWRATGPRSVTQV